MTHKNPNEQAWKEIHAAARAEFPDAMNDPRRKQPGRAWQNKKTGMIEPYNAAEHAAYDAMWAKRNAAAAEDARIQNNILHHEQDKSRRRAQIDSEKRLRRTEEAQLRQLKHVAKNPNRFDTLYFILAVLFVYGMVRFVMWLGGV